MRRQSDGSRRQRWRSQASLPALPTVQVPARKLLPEMNEEELITWLKQHQEELETFCSYAQVWRISRHQRGIHTENDERYDRFFVHAADLIAGLAEWRENLEAAANEENQSRGQL